VPSDGSGRRPIPKLSAPMLSAGQTLPLTIEKPAAGGRMIARVHGQVVLVSGAIPGERVVARVERVGKGVAYAQTVGIEEASADRRAIEAEPGCGGCLYAHIAYPRQIAIKSLVIADAFARIARLPLPAAVPIAASPEEGYRMRARLHVRGGALGFFREATHQVCDARPTRQLLPATVDALDRLAAAIRPLGRDLIREIELAENIDASERVVHLDASAPLDPRALEALAGTDGLTGLTSRSGTRGSAHVTDAIALGGPTVSLRRHVLAFFQGNRFLLRDLAGHVAALVTRDVSVLDLYAGAGLFALAAAARGARVTAVEGDRIAAADLVANSALMNGAVTPVHDAVEAFVGRVHRERAGQAVPHTVIVDPPRAGMSREALDGVLGLGSPRIVYVSCDVATLARDLRRIVDAGYTIDRVDGFDLFPNTPHVETVAVLSGRW
jgi:23S rRNA (uracil1939-C5)-methyltransferase